METVVSYDVTDWVLSDQFWARTLLERLYQSSVERGEALVELVTELARQLQAEEAVILPSADRFLLLFGEHRRRYEEDRTKIGELLGRLEQHISTAEEFLTRLKQLQQTLGDHARYVEHEILAPLKHCLSDDERFELGGLYAEARLSSESSPPASRPTPLARVGSNNVNGPLVAHLSRA